MGSIARGPSAKQGRKASVDVWESQKEEKTAELAEREADKMGRHAKDREEKVPRVEMGTQ